MTQWAAILAIGEQIGHHRLGNINYGLYALAKAPPTAGVFHDIADGSSNSIPDLGGLGTPIAGYTTVSGYDMATGLGTPNIGALAPVLALLPQHQ